MNVVWGIFFFVLSVSSVFSQTYKSSGELLWEIDNGKNKSYLWGTLHSNKKDLFQFPDSVFWAFSICQKVALEMDVFDYFLEKEPIIEERNVLLDKRGKMYTSSDEPSPTFYGTEDGMPQFMDAFFQEEAERAGKTIIALESPDLQTQALGSTPLVDQGIYGGASGQELLQKLYLEGRISVIDQLLRARFSQQQQGYIDLIEKRNERISEKVFQELKTNTVFCAVGAAHLYGEKGIVHLLRLKGCKVRKMQLTTVNSTSPKGFPTQRKFEYYNSFDGSVVKAIFPGIPRAIPFGVVFKELGQGNTYKIQWQSRDTALTLLEYAEILMAPPPNCPYTLGVLDDGTQYVQGLSDAYPDRLAWKRILMNEHHIAVLTCQGGNKMMNSNRPNLFFNNVVLE